MEASMTANPDLILHRGLFTTLDRANPTATAVAITDGKFSLVGRDNDVMKLAGKETKVIDIKGRRVLPGLIDNYLHIIRGGLNFNLEMRWDGVRSLADARLEALQCLGHGRTGNAELAGGAGERAGFGDFGEDRPALEIRKGHVHPQKNGKRVFPFFLFLRCGSRTIWNYAFLPGFTWAEAPRDLKCLPSRP
jgi:hypothetical protein